MSRTKKKFELDYLDVIKEALPEVHQSGIITSSQLRALVEMYKGRIPSETFISKELNQRFGNPRPHLLRPGAYFIREGIEVQEMPKAALPSPRLVGAVNIPYPVLSVKFDDGKPEETDEEIDKRITKAYANMESLIQSVADGYATSIVISGSAGVGKSYTVEKVLDRNGNRFTIIKGYVKATSLFKLLYDHRDDGEILVLDDSDSVLKDEVSLNLLKAALELSDRRHLTWGSEKEFISEDGEVIPKTFEYRGNFVLLTNLNFDDLISKGDKLSPHLEAIESRTLYLDLGIRTKREIFIRIKQVVKSGMLQKKGIDKDDEELVMLYIEDNLDNLKTLNLRSCEKLGVLVKANPDNWMELADSIMLKKK